MRTLPLLGDRYRLGPIIGTGGMGAVHRAYDERFGREVAVKVMRAGADAVEQERLRREAQYLAGLDHPNLVAVYDAGADSTRTGETVWFAMELMHGPDLRALIRARGRLAPSDVARVLDGCAGALQVLHAAGVVHRDLKPANVLLTTDPEREAWEVKIADLGIAQLVRAEHLTATGQVIGTAAYLSPEQVSGGRMGPASDVYSLGLLAIEALTGRVAFPGGPAESATARLVRAPDVPAGAGPEWAALLAEMTARDPADRPTAGEVAHRLELLPRLQEAIADPEATAVLPPPLPASRRAVEDVSTEAMTVQDVPVRVRSAARVPEPAAPGVTTDWAPSLRPRRRRVLRGRRGVLAVAGIVTAIAVAGGGVAVVAGSSGAEATAQPTGSVPAKTGGSSGSSEPKARPTRTAATKAHAATAPGAASAHPVPSGTPVPDATPSRSATRAATTTGGWGGSLEERFQQTAGQGGYQRLRHLQDRLEHDLRHRFRPAG